MSRTVMQQDDESRIARHRERKEMRRASSGNPKEYQFTPGLPIYTAPALERF